MFYLFTYLLTLPLYRLRSVRPGARRVRRQPTTTNSAATGATLRRPPPPPPQLPEQRSRSLISPARALQATSISNPT